MSNSPLVSYTLISPNKSKRTAKIAKITPHHTAWVVDVETLGASFANPSRKASSNYGIGNDGRIAMYVPEDYRAWTSSSSANDNVAVTIEVSNSATGGNWPISNEAWDSLVALCVDICRRNGIEKLSFTGDKSGNLTMHKMFAATNCPGTYLGGRFPELAETVNKILREGDDDMTDEQVRKIVREELTGNGKAASDWAVSEVEAAKALGITDGSRPQGYAKREEVFALFNRYDDKHGVGEAVKEAVAAVIERIKGVL
jgi:hypothetical protein